ncbi:hypothetical protein LTR78_004022 [Recurvomyces mirabilis]|uniref:Uncharacterized protein n=1 Tax=Recurvomyces mirabilis TaxID=574656 RepID=A0AAE1C324_9PEZI|nr:hypothetical protein LTR78_004022 [Recurvomyces mirabilis]KAK5153840.1 hypothetical protein LTS14_007059 [Recurvomyces mirabilis]
MSQSPALTILLDILTEYKDRIAIDGSSRILVTDATVAQKLAEQHKDISTPYGPTFTVASAAGGAGEGTKTEDLGQNITVEAMDSLMPKMDYFTHAITDVSLADGKTVMEIMKWAKYALKPKGIAVVVALKRTEAGEFKERMLAQSKQRIADLGDIFEFAGFETGKVRRLERGSGEAEAEVVLGMKWDQLTA